MSNLSIPPWNEMAPLDGFQYKVTDINSFSVSATFSAITDWDDASLKAKLQERLREDIASLLRTACRSKK